ncbi:MAG: hemolysin III family protein [Chloroflexi bacterium]|nr:MAG: hemolysin III family protein [Chloroflexota bacterium]
MHWQAKDPASCYSHLLGVALSITGLVTLIVESHGDPRRVVGFSIYGASLILLYSASTIYHWQALSPRGEDILKRLDHVAIFVLIAGSYTPVGWSVFGVVWGLAVVGVTLKLFFEHLPRWLSTALYVGMGWMAVIAIVPLVQILPVSGMMWLVTGGVLYTLGAVIYAVQWPNPVAEVFGFHEVFHVFVLAGSITHFVFMMRYVLPGA